MRCVRRTAIVATKNEQTCTEGSTLENGRLKDDKNGTWMKLAPILHNDGFESLLSGVRKLMR